MELQEFFDKVEEHKDLEGVGVVKGDEKHSPGFDVKYKPQNMCSRISVNVIKDNDWETIEPILTFKKEPEQLFHMSRVVGYFSRIENWNKSKIGELRDRHKGDYKIAS